MRHSGTRIAPGIAIAVCCAAAWAMISCAPPPGVQTPEPEARAERPSQSPRHHQSRHHEGVAEQGAHRDRGRPAESARSPDSRRDGTAAAGIPDKVTNVLRQIDEHNAAPAGYEGGRVFHNAGRDGERALPRVDDEGRPISYREWDVNPKVPGVNRGAERLVTGSDGSAYYTDDHYRSFAKVR
jgi:guanyl-specific ribonuclease Sa